MWQQTAAKIGMQRCAASSQWLSERISLSRYAHVILLPPCQLYLFLNMLIMDVNVSNLLGQVPLGNFESDWLLFTADVFFSRALRDQQQVFVLLII